MLITSMHTAYRSFIEHRARASAARMLSGLNDATLKDMGIHRSQIESVVEHMPLRGGR
jgi:uncharacterized protein YjiS (DUF1127 family)